MKNEPSGGSTAEGNADRLLEERLSDRFAVEFEQAERDYPTLGRLRREPGERSRRHGSAWPRLAAATVAIAVLALGGLVGLGLTARSAPGGPAQSDSVRGAEFLPKEIDGQRVYRVGEKSEWQGLTGSFLLAVLPATDPVLCPEVPSDRSAADGDLVGCSGIVLNDWTDANTRSDAQSLIIAPKGNFWADLLAYAGQAIVLRVHTNDSEAAQCSVDRQALCEAAVVMEAVVWPALPADIAGERIYRATDKESFPTTGTFLLGGLFSKPAFIPPCPARVGVSDAEQQLVAYCYVLSIDGLMLAPKSTVDEPNGELVVARVHINDELAAHCPAETQNQCRVGVVAESIVWKSDEVLTQVSMASPVALVSVEAGMGSGGALPSAPDYGGSAAASGPEGSPAAVGSPGLDGVPTAVGGQPVYRASNLPNLQEFYLGGVLGHTTCPLPAPSGAASPGGPASCDYWTIDGVVVSNVSVPDAMVGAVVVAYVIPVVEQSPCPIGGCTGIPGSMWVFGIIWTGPIPPPQAATPSLPPVP